METYHSLFLNGDKEEGVEVDAPATRYATLLVENANVRQEPDLNSNLVTTAAKGDQLKYLERKQKDGAGREWFQVQMDNGEIGWISSKIVKLNE